MTEHAHHNIASAASPDDAAREAAPPTSSARARPASPLHRRPVRRPPARSASPRSLRPLTLLFAAAVLATQAFNVELFDAHHPFSFGAPDIEVVETMLDASGNEVPALVDDRINPGSGAVSRIVRVQNLGHASDVRARDAERGRRAAQRRRAVARPRRDVRLRRRVRVAAGAGRPVLPGRRAGTPTKPRPC